MGRLCPRSSGTDDDLPVFSALGTDALRPGDGLNFAVREDCSDVGVVVEGYDPASFEALDSLPKPVDVGHGPRAVKGRCAVRVRGIHEEKRPWPVPNVEAAVPGEVFNNYTVKADIELADRVHAGRPGAGGPGSATDRGDAESSEVPATETISIAEEPPCRPLDVSETGLMGEILELLAGVEDELEFGEQGLGMESDAAIKGDQVAVDVVQDFDLGSRFRQKNREASGKRFHVAVVFGDGGQNVVEETAFSARPRHGRFEGWFRQIMVLRWSLIVGFASRKELEGWDGL